MPAAPHSPDDQIYFVIPLSVQREGDDDYCVGNAQLDAFYHFPLQGVRIVEWLREGRSPRTIKTDLSIERIDLDVDDFIATLREIGFVYPDSEGGQYVKAISATAGSDRRIRFAIPQPIARTIFSPASLAIYLAILSLAVYSAIADPRLRLNFSAFYLESHLTLTLVLLLVLYGITASMHELGHILAAARLGVQSRLGMGNRMWSLVAEADLSGILALPKAQRYLPLLGGMIVDLLSVSLITLLIGWLLARGHTGFEIQLMQAWILQILISMSWQFNVFMKTDIYYVLCNYFGHPDLDREARIYLRDRMHALTFGAIGEKASGGFDRAHLGVLRAFATIWLVGRIASLAFLFLILIPTLARYFVRARDAFADPAGSRAFAYDAAAFAAISALLFMIGMTLWLRRRKSADRTIHPGDLS